MSLVPRTCCAVLCVVNMYEDECGNYICMKYVVRTFHVHLKHNIIATIKRHIERRKRDERYERISTIDYESQITITITFINITIVKLFTLFLHNTQHYTCCPKLVSSRIPRIARAQFRLDISLSLSLGWDGRTSRFNTFSFLHMKNFMFPIIASLLSIIAHRLLHVGWRYGESSWREELEINKTKWKMFNKCWLI